MMVFLIEKMRGFIFFNFFFLYLVANLEWQVQPGQV